MVKSTVDSVAHAIASAPRRLLVGPARRGPGEHERARRGLGVTLPAIDKHVRVLEAAGLARKRRAGRRAVVTLEPGGLDLLADWATGVRAMWRARLADFAAHVGTQPSAPDHTTGRDQPTGPDQEER